MTTTELLATRDEISKLLPDLTTIDLSAELVGTYLKLKELMEDSLDDLENTSPNKLASLITSVNGSLKQLADYQKELYGVQRQRAFERAIKNTFEHADEALVKTFLDLLEIELEEL
jgi:predicted transcriptional regulator